MSYAREHVVVRVVDVYVYRIEEGRAASFLLLRRGAGRVYEGQWRMVGGKVHLGETAWQSAAREVEEETGRKPARLWALPSVNAFYEWEADRVNLIPAFAAELDGDAVLNAEHDAFEWLAAEEAAARLGWPEQRRLVRLTAELLANEILPELVIDPARLAL